MKHIFLFSLIALLSFSCTKKASQDYNTVYGVMDANVSGFDPINATNTYASKSVSQVYEGLYHYHYFKRPLELEPQLAESMPIISDKGLTYTIKIKKNVFFQDDPAFPNGKGREVTAQDFIYSWKRLADPSNKALAWWIFDGKIKGLNQWRTSFQQAKANYDSPIEGLSAPDKYTLVIKLTQPSYQFSLLLAMPGTFVVAREVVDKYGKEIINHPVGTGPYKLVSWTRNSEIRYKKNPNYREVLYPSEGTAEDKEKGFLKDAGKKLPLTENIVIKIMPERQPMWLSFLKGALDHGIIPKDNYAQVYVGDKLSKDILDKEISVHFQYRPDFTYLSFNLEHPILGKNKNLRKAMAYAYDIPTSLEKFYNNRGIEAQGPIPPGLDGYDPELKKPIHYNLEKAKEYMVKAGYPGGKGLPTIGLELANSGSWSRQMGEFVKNQMALIGINIRIIPNTFPQFDKKVKSKKADIFQMAWMADYPDAENFLQLYYSKNISPGSNNSNFMNRKYDAMYEKAIALQPGPERTKLYKEMVKFIHQEVPNIFLIHRIYRLPYHAWLKNYNEYPVIHDFYQYLRIDGEKKKEIMKKL
jgi:oligopeptide transport system substrate-binding protein